MRCLFVACLSLAFLTPAFADPAPPAQPDSAARAMPYVIAQREQALSAWALCQSDASAAQGQLAEAKAKIDELTKELAAAKGKTN